MSYAVRHGTAILGTVTEAAVKRRLQGQRGAFWSPSELQTVADAIAAVNGTAELLGRATVHRRLEQAERHHGVERFAEDAQGNEHAPAGESDGGQFVGKRGGGGRKTKGDKKTIAVKGSPSKTLKTPEEHAKAAAEDYAKNGTKAKAFKEWFGDSKIVDAQGEPEQTHKVNGEGKPLTVYHGTPSGEFEQFKLHKAGSNVDSGFLGQGFYFTNDQKVANYYATRGAAKAPTVIPAYLSVKNPFDWGKKTLGVRGLVMQGKPLPPEIHDKVIAKTGFKYNPDAEPDFNDEKMLSEAVRNELIAMGHDGVMSDVGNGQKEYVAFHPEQIKAVANRGTFDSKDARINMAECFDEGDAPDFTTTPTDMGPHLTTPVLPMKPDDALAWFLLLFPLLNVDRKAWPLAIAAEAMTLAQLGEQVVADRVETAIANRLTVLHKAAPTGLAPKHLMPTPSVLEDILNDIGVTPENSGYGEDVFDTNTKGSFNDGITKEIASPAMEEEFPAWWYRGVGDGRQRPAHRVQNGKYFPSVVPFADVRDYVRGKYDGFRCRCNPVVVYKKDWARLLQQGARFSRLGE